MTYLQTFANIKSKNTNNILVYIFSGGQWISGDDRVLIEERSGYNYANLFTFTRELEMFVKEERSLLILNILYLLKAVMIFGSKFLITFIINIKSAMPKYIYPATGQVG